MDQDRAIGVERCFRNSHHNPRRKSKMKPISRREFMRASALGAAGAAIVACQPQTVIVKETVKETVVVEKEVQVEKEVTKVVEKEVEKVVKETVVVEATPTPMPDQEAPQWVDMVASGELPPLEERLPTDVEIVEPYERIGEYGGNIRIVMVGGATYHIRSAYGPEGLLRVDRDNSTIIPNVVQAWDLTEDGTEYTFYLRRGHKWSDGEPFDADEMAFWWDDFMLNDELMPGKPRVLQAGGELMEFEKVDQYTVKWKFAAPYPFLILRLGHAEGVNELHRMQGHYLKQFHADYGDKAELDNMVADAELESWTQLYNRMRGNSYGMPQDEDRGMLPTMLPMKFKQRDDPLRVFDRNPFYWKTDTSGNQLPYIDQVICTNVESAEIADAMISAGEVNFSPAFVATLPSYPLYKQGEEGGGYRTLLFNGCESTAVCYQPNHTVNDPMLREIFNDVRFKQALSLALDREEINQAVYQGLGIPVQTHVVVDSKFFVKEYEQAYVEYDPDQANELLDEVGLDQRDGDGYRLRSDGQRMMIDLTFFAARATHTANAELVKEMWEDVGIQVNLQSVSGDLIGERVAANEVQFGLWHADKCTDVLYPQRPEWFVPYSVGWEKPWGVEWARWYSSGGEEGEEPPSKVMDLFTTWETMQETMDEYEQVSLGRQILKSQADNLWTIGTVGRLPEPVIVGDNMVNFPETGYTGYDFLNTYPYHSEQYFFEGGAWSNEPG
jgi:peptide/nickel transport system substrate-binding protein